MAVVVPGAASSWSPASAWEPSSEAESVKAEFEDATARGNFQPAVGSTIETALYGPGEIVESIRYVIVEGGA